MASSHVQKECEAWVVSRWLPRKFEMEFSPQRLQMQARGHFAFDAVSEDRTLVANISTASALTYRGAVSAGSRSKIRADCLMLSLAEAQRRFLLLTELSMFKLSSDEQGAGRLPLNIEIMHVDLPPELMRRLADAKLMASKEVRGGS